MDGDGWRGMDGDGWMGRDEKGWMEMDGWRMKEDEER